MMVKIFSDRGFIHRTVSGNPEFDADHNDLYISAKNPDDYGIWYKEYIGPFKAGTIFTVLGEWTKSGQIRFTGFLDEKDTAPSMIKSFSPKEDTYIIPVPCHRIYLEAVCCSCTEAWFYGLEMWIRESK